MAKKKVSRPSTASSLPTPARRGNAGVAPLPGDYEQFIGELKAQIAAAQTRAALAVNGELIRLYWTVGKEIHERQQAEGWGSQVIDRLAADLGRAFPGLEGFSRTNIYRMRAFFQAWRLDDRIVPQPVGQFPLPPTPPPVDSVVPQPVGQFPAGLPAEVAEIPWGHNIALVEKLGDRDQRLWYARQTIENGWSRAVLVHQIETGLYERQGQAVTNFDRTLPPPQSDLLRQVLKDPYSFDFLTIAAEADERVLERTLLAHIRQFLLELGSGFAFIGSQHHLEVGGQDYYLDLFFYHILLRSFVVIDLKVEAFKPEFAGKMNFYLSAVDAQYRGAHDAPTVGIILCKEKNNIIVEYALRDTTKPIGVAEYRIGQVLPPEVRDALPSPEQLQAELIKAMNETQPSTGVDEKRRAKLE